MKRTVLLLIIVIIIGFLAGYQQEELESYSYKQYLQARGYYETILKQNQLLVYAAKEIESLQKEVELYKALVEGRITIEIKPIPKRVH